MENMEFGELCIKDIHSVLRYTPSIRQWKTKNRQNHIVGIQLRGGGRHIFENQEFTITPNCVYFLNIKDNFRVIAEEDTEAFSIHFTTEKEICTNSFCFPVSNPASIISLLSKAESAFHSGNHLSLYSLSYQLCAQMEQIRQKSYFPRDKRMLEAKNYMDLHFKEKDCLAEAILQSGLGQRRFSDLFFSNFDLTPNRYLVIRKIEYAKTLLSLGEISVSHAAAACGFSDVYYFSKVFKKETGVSPARWNTPTIRL